MNNQRNPKIEELISCRVCLEIFDETSKRPRVLGCGHSFCNNCLQKLMLDLIALCPFCKVEFQPSVDKIPINFSLESLATRLHGHPGEFRSEGHCDKHNIYKGLYCMEHKMCICAMCGSLEHKPCRTPLVSEALKELKAEISCRVDKKLLESLANLDRINDSLKHLESQKLKESKFCEELKHLQIGIEESETCKELSKAQGNIEYLLEIENLRRSCRDGEVYVMVELKESQLFGKVKVKEDRVWIYSFQPLKPDLGSKIFDLKVFLKQFGTALELTRTFFLQMTPEGSTSGDINVLIETTASSPRVLNFLCFCSALKGVSYKGKTMGRNWYCYRISPGPAPIVEGINNDDSKTSMNVGDVHGMTATDSGFEIKFSDGYFNSHKFGRVVSGLQSLQELGKDCIVSDCGLVI